MKPRSSRFLVALSNGLGDFLRDGSRTFSLITLWMNGFCALFLYAYWRVIELTKTAPPKEMTAGVIAIVLFYITSDAVLAQTYLKASAGGYDPTPEAVSTTTANTIVAPVIMTPGAPTEGPPITTTPSASGD